MRLCDALVLDPDDEENRCPDGPLRSTGNVERLRCFACGGWTPHGRLLPIDHVAALAREATSILAQLERDYRWAHSVAFAPTRRRNPAEASGKGDHGDPTGDHVADTARARTRDFAIVAARLLERAVRDLRAADEAIGEALLAAEPPGPVDHTKAPYHDTMPDNRPDLADAYDARGRRWGRGEGIPS
jgi:hypothetical protein